MSISELAIFPLGVDSRGERNEGDPASLTRTMRARPGRTSPPSTNGVRARPFARLGRSLQVPHIERTSDTLKSDVVPVPVTAARMLFHGVRLTPVNLKSCGGGGGGGGAAGGAAPRAPRPSAGGRPLGHPQVVPRRLGAARLRPELRPSTAVAVAPRQEDPAVVEAVGAE